MTPSDVEVLIHCHCIGTPHPRLTAPAVAGTVEKFLADGLIEVVAGIIDSSSVLPQCSQSRAHAAPVMEMAG